MSIDKKTFSTDLYNYLVEGKEGVLKAIGATMNIAYSLWNNRSLDVVKKLDVSGFSNSSEQNEEATDFINNHAIELINSGYQTVSKNKKKLFTDIDNFKKDEPEMLRVLRDSLPVAMFLIKTDCVGSINEKHFATVGNRTTMYINKLKFSKTMQENFKMSADIFDVSFSDLQKYSNYYYFKSLEKEDAKHPVHALANKFMELMNKKADDKTGKLNAKGKQLMDTLDSIVKTIKHGLTQLDIELAYEEIDEIVLHLQSLAGYGNNNMVQGVRIDDVDDVPVKFIGLVAFDYKQNAIITRDIKEHNIYASNLKTIPHYTKTGTSKK